MPRNCASDRSAENVSRRSAGEIRNELSLYSSSTTMRQ